MKLKIQQQKVSQLDFQDNDNNIQELMNIFQAESEEILERIFENLLAFENKPTDKELAATISRLAQHQRCNQNGWV